MDKIVCIGKNYAEHAKELGDAIPDKPVLFLKPPSVLQSVTRNDELLVLRVPPDSGEVHHECEIVLKLNRDGYRMSVEEARASIGELTLGLDMTLRERQAKLKKQGHPWELSKAFLDSAAVGPWVPVSAFPDWMKTQFTFTLGGVLKQSGMGQQMTLSPVECVAYASEHFPLKAGDLIFTGTPAGVGPVALGQRAELEWGSIRYRVEWRPYS